MIKLATTVVLASQPRALGEMDTCCLSHFVYVVLLWWEEPIKAE